MVTFLFLRKILVVMLYFYFHRYVLFLIRGWRNWVKSTYGNINDCITTNAYTCLELNAHALILLMVGCRERNAPEQFLVLFFSSQPAEELFRELRSMTTTQHTQVDFTLKEFGEKLRRAQMKLRVAYRNKHMLKFPTIDRRESKYTEVFELPSDEEIFNKIEEAQQSASRKLQQLGINETEGLFEDSLQKRQMLFAFVCTEDVDGDDLNDDYDIDEMETVEPPEVSAILDSTAPDEDSSELEEATEETHDSNIDDDIKTYEASLLFPNMNNNLNLKSSTTKKHTFKIRDSTGKIFFIKKSTLVWMLTTGRHRRVATRVARYMQPNANRGRSVQLQSTNSNVDEPLKILTIGDWTCFEENIICEVKGFKSKEGIDMLVKFCNRLLHHFLHYRTIISEPCQYWKSKSSSDE